MNRRTKFVVYLQQITKTISPLSGYADETEDFHAVFHDSYGL